MIHEVKTSVNTYSRLATPFYKNCLFLILNTVFLSGRVIGMKCIFCGFEEDLEEHHLIPKCRHKRYRKKRFSSEELKQTILICDICHDQIHTLITETDMALRYNTEEKLKEHPDVKRWVEWIKRKRA